MTLRGPAAALLAACLLALLATAAPAAAGTAPCVRGGSETCRTWTGRVVDVNDGDTVSVVLDGDRRRIDVRLHAIQAMELTRYHPRRRRGQCHAVEATLRLEALLRRAGGRVRLAARRAGRRDALGRFIRSVAVRSGGGWRDVGERLVAEGHALWLPDAVDAELNERYNRAAQRAARRGRNLWNPVHCGRGPQQELPIEVWAQSDPVGVDSENVDGEWIAVRNRGDQALDLGGWWLRDAGLRRFTFPAGTRVAPQGAVRLHVGRGPSRPGVFSWGLREPVLENASDPGAGDDRHLGDGAFLFDPRGDLRAWMLWPCVVGCSDPRQGALALTAQPGGREALTVRNTSGAPVVLHGLQLALTGSTYEFPEGAVLQPGAAVVVEVGGDPADDTQSRRFWGIDRPLLPDAGGAIRLMTYDRIVLACAAWGRGRCAVG